MSAAQPERIEPGGKVERRLAEGETHPYLVRLEAGEYVRIAAEQRGVDLVLRLVAPGGGLIAEIDSPTGTRGAERVSEVAAVTGDYRAEVVGGEGTTPGTYVVRIEEKCTATDAHRRKVEGERVFQEGERLRRENKEEEAITRYERALALWQDAGDLEGQAAALFSIGWMKDRLDRWEEAAGVSAQAAALYRQTGDSTGRAQALNRYGRLLGQLGRRAEARPPLEEAVLLFRGSGDPEKEATALINLGNVLNWDGHFEQAVDCYDQALAVWRRLRNRNEEVKVLLSFGDLYMSHGKLIEAKESFEGAQRIADEIGDGRQLAEAFDNLGRLAFREGRLVEARVQGEKALALFRELGDRRDRAIILNSLGLVLLKSGDPEGAQARFSEALSLFHALADAQGEAMVTAHLGRVALAKGDARHALELERTALARFERMNDRQGLSLAHYGAAQALVKLGDLEQALQEIEASLAIAESQRAETASLDLRASYFSTRQHYWELYIDVLMTLDRLHPAKGFAVRALEADERRRARSLLDALAEVRAEIRKSANPALLREEEDIQRRLERTRQPEEVTSLLADLDSVRTRMRKDNPRLARIESSEVLSLPEIQKRLLDKETLLLVYSLGEERSVLWTVARSTLTPHLLPGRDRIEKAAGLVRDVLSHRLQTNSRLRQTAVEDLAAIVLEPAAADLAKFKRLLIVADGALQMVPFAALPDPGADRIEGRRPLLVEGHPIIYLPSASVGATLRKEKPASVSPPSPLIAVLADPVFDASDSRVKGQGQASVPASGTTRGSLARSLRDLGMTQLERLPFSREEARAIQSLWRSGEVLPALDFSANGEVLADDRWRQAAILHFATHSLLNDRQPELSGLVFSRVGPDGAPRTDGFLPLHDVYALNLKAGMVVLSACQTGSGKVLRGEGLLGLTRGFMSIGVPQLVASLWKVEDQATAELMTRFYREFYEGKQPSEALQEAQKSMLSDPRWSNPSLWAGFIFLGDYQGRPGGGIETAETGGSSSSRRADTGGMPGKGRPRPKPKPPEQEKAPKPPVPPGEERRVSEKLYFNGITTRGQYVTPPITAEELAQRVRAAGLDAPSEWVLDMTRERPKGDRKRRPILDIQRKWDLAETGWAVVYAPGTDRKVKLALRDLIEHREGQAAGGGRSTYFRSIDARPGESLDAFLRRPDVSAGQRGDPDFFPYYVLLVGDPESLPYNFQQELDVGYAVGRICFDRPEDYKAYARSVVQAETKRPVRPRQVAFFGTSHENDPATEEMARTLVRPLSEGVVEPEKGWEIRSAIGADARKEQLRKFLGGPETPALLFAGCHGLEVDMEDDVERQREMQGALICQDWPGPDEWVDEDHWFAAKDVPGDASLDGLIAFFMACYGVGTPARDNFSQNRLARAPRIAPAAFASRLPQRMLSHPGGGALAVIGHVDKAWVTGFAGSEKGEGRAPYLNALKRLLEGHTVGWAVEDLNLSYASFAAQLGNLWEAEQLRDKVTDPVLFSNLWTYRNDARNYVVFGDPAVRLPGVGEPR